MISGSKWGLTVHRDLLASDEIIDSGGVPITTALRTAWDLARWLPTVEAVVALDALARVGRFAPTAVLRIHDMAYPLLKLAIEYDGRGHLTPWQQQSDARRLNRLDECGWSVRRFTAPDVLRTPDAMAAHVREAISRRRSTS